MFFLRADLLKRTGKEVFFSFVCFNLAMTPEAGLGCLSSKPVELLTSRIKIHPEVLKTFSTSQ